ncbi:endothelin-converting enzyme [Apodospora peruviana]|uniref:Endothelin-converting enzyme n=1 Tax=Apodospora peruviana TaxID=516989 RepID=A0AAE0HZG7_9PEZI|nr:endothelin-converting enzyme [Apodospora peruviana]
MKVPRVAQALCMTPACVQLGAEYAANLSPNHAQIDPCTNFEELVCGGWNLRHELRPDQGSTGTIDLMSEDNEAKLRKIIEGAYPGESSHSHFSPRNLDTAAVSIDQQNFDMMQTAYNACMDEASIAKLGVAPIITVLDQMSKVFAPPGDYSGLALFVKTVGASSLLSIYVDTDPKDPDVTLIGVMPSTGIGLGSKSYYEDPELVSEYRDAIAQLFAAIHPSSVNTTPVDAAKQAVDVVDFETKIAAIMPELSDLRDVVKSYNPMSLNEIAKLIPQLGIPKIIKALAPANYTPGNIIVGDPAYLSKLSSLISETPRTTIASYFQWKVIQGLETIVIARETMKPYTHLKNKLRGREPDAVSERWRTCLAHVDDGLGWILSRFFIEMYFSARDKDLGNEIIAALKQVYIDKFNKLDWMDAEVKAAAVEKIRTIEQKIGYPSASPNITDPVDLKDYYADINITPTYSDNVLSLTSWALNQTWSDLGKPTDRKEWGMTAPTVNAYYNPSLNEIAFPAGIMQPPIFSGDLPGYINYGSFGSVAGHEISHGFDDSGRQYDSKGRFQDWWTNATLIEYERRSKCFVDEFNNFTVIGSGNRTISVKGQQTLGENIADSAGISASYAAWQESRRKGEGEDENNLLLPGFGFNGNGTTLFKTPEQMFFVAYGNLWCTKSTPGALTSQVLTDVHAPGQIRIKGTVMNSRGFREAFGCKVREPTCELW